MSEPKNRVQSVDLACSLLRELQERESAGITDLAESLGYAKSAIHTQLATLEANELIVKDGTSYRLSLRFLDMAESVKEQISKYDVITSEVDSLANKTDEVVQFGTEEHGWLVYLYKARGEMAVETASSIGKREYLHSTSLGKSILSTYPKHRIEKIIQMRGLPSKTQQTITNKEELYDELEQVREKGYAFDDEENIQGLRCVSVPVYSDSDDVLGAISISGPSQRMTLDRIEDELVTDASKSANVIQINYRFS